jgi:hypothetical protein
MSALSAAQLYNGLETSLPRGTPTANFTVALVVDVTDNLGATARCTSNQDGSLATVQVLQSTNNTATLEKLNAKLNEQVALGNVEGLLRSLQVCPPFPLLTPLSILQEGIPPYYLPPGTCAPLVHFLCSWQALQARPVRTRVRVRHAVHTASAFEAHACVPQGKCARAPLTTVL